MHVRLDRILVPTDLSPLGDQAVAYAIALAPPGATLHLLHVLEPAPTPNRSTPTSSAARRRASRTWSSCNTTWSTRCGRA